jgi:hypothetical protein
LNLKAHILGLSMAKLTGLKLLNKKEIDDERKGKRGSSVCIKKSMYPERKVLKHPSKVEG